MRIYAGSPLIGIGNSGNSAGSNIGAVGTVKDLPKDYSGQPANEEK